VKKGVTHANAAQLGHCSNATRVTVLFFSYVQIKGATDEGILELFSSHQRDPLIHEYILIEPLIDSLIEYARKLTTLRILTATLLN
jgi:hypothetical protein